MRTTLNIDDDLLAAVKERARRERRTAGEVFSELVREALVGHGRPEASEEESFHGFAPFPRRGGAVSNALIDQLLEEGGE